MNFLLLQKEKGFPIKWAKAPTVPFLEVLPITYSTIIKGILHKNKNVSHAIRKLPAPSSPPLEAAMRGNLHIFPVPTAIPSALTKKPNLEENRGVDLDIINPHYVQIFQQ